MHTERLFMPIFYTDWQWNRKITGALGSSSGLTAQPGFKLRSANHQDSTIHQREVIDSLSRRKGEVVLFFVTPIPSLQPGPLLAAGQSGPKHRALLMAFINAALWMRRAPAHRAARSRTAASAGVKHGSVISAASKIVLSESRTRRRIASASLQAGAVYASHLRIIFQQFRGRPGRDCGGRITSFPFLTWAKLSILMLPWTALLVTFELLKKWHQPKYCSYKKSWFALMNHPTTRAGWRSGRCFRSGWHSAKMADFNRLNCADFFSGLWSFENILVVYQAKSSIYIKNLSQFKNWNVFCYNNFVTIHLGEHKWKLFLVQKW